MIERGYIFRIDGLELEGFERLLGVGLSETCGVWPADETRAAEELQIAIDGAVRIEVRVYRITGRPLE